MNKVHIGSVDVSRLVIGGNPFSGFSHQTSQRDQEMLQYFTNEQIRRLLHEAEAAGVNTVFARTDEHVMGVLREYWDEGGTIQWFAQVVFDQTQPDVHRQWIAKAGELGASGMYIHGGATDFWHANGQEEMFHESLRLIRAWGIPGGFAGHRSEAHAWVRDHVRPDFQMCAYYNPTDRSQQAQHTNVGEKWDTRDRSAMLQVIASLPTPAVHYKVFAAGNRPIDEAFQVLGQSVRKNDIICVGVFPKDDPDMLAKDIRLFEYHVEHKAS